jgi:probable phosphoglycerate mutase
VNATRLIFIRHAESTWNAAGRWQGHGDPPLSERGRLQATQCAESIAGVPVDWLVCSDLRRTRETAVVIGRALGLEVRPNARLRELDVGSWTGLTREEIRAREPEILERFDAGAQDVRAGGGETREEIRGRVLAEVEALVEKHPGACIVLVVHSGVIRALAPELGPENCERVELTVEEIRESCAQAAFSTPAIL